MHRDDPARVALLTVLLPLLGTFAACRLYLHLVDPNADATILGYNVHHLFTGSLIALPAAFALAVGARSRAARRVARALLGVGSALVLDEIVYLIVTDGSNAAYLTPASLRGALLLVGAAVAALLAMHFGSASCARAADDVQTPLAGLCAGGGWIPGPAPGATSRRPGAVLKEAAAAVTCSQQPYFAQGDLSRP